MQEGPERPKLPLKKVGGGMDVELASLAVTHLRRLLEREPREFQALVALVEGRTEGVSPASIAFLRQNLFLAEDGSPLPAVAEVLRAAYRPETPDGPCLVDPLAPRGPEDVAAAEGLEKRREGRAKDGPRRLLRDLLAEAEQRGDEGMRRRLRRALGEGDDKGRSRG